MKDKKNSEGKWDLDCLGPVDHERIVFSFSLEYLFIYINLFILTEGRIVLRGMIGFIFCFDVVVECCMEAGRPNLHNWDRCICLLSGLPAHVQWQKLG